MYIELIDLLRCPKPHDESWLVAAFNRMDGRFVIEGKLGCPVCSSSYPISCGVADFRSEPLSSSVESTSEVISDDLPMRVAGMLGLTRAGAAVVLCGMPAAVAGAIAELANVRVVSANPTLVSKEAENVAAVHSEERLPFAAGSIDALMLSDDARGVDMTEAVRVLKTGGRLVAPANATLAGNLRELARDDRYIVAEFTGPLVGLSR